MGQITLDIITSKNNQLIKDTKKLLTSSKYRAEQNAFVLEGARLSFDVLNSIFKVKLFLITNDAYAKYQAKADEMISIADSSFLISDEVSQKLGETANCQGVFCVCEMQSKEKPLGDKVIALDNVQDPSNVGAIIRTAEALGISNIITYNCCDIYNSKALRASMGSILRMSIIDTNNLENMLSSLLSEYNVYSTVPSADAMPITSVDFLKPSICVIGNEANGVEESIKAISTEITIPMLGRAESLNASIAGSITMWEMLR